MRERLHPGVRFMKRRLIIEGLVFITLGFVGFIEGIRITVDRDPRKLYDLLGPGWYMAILGLAMIIVGLIYVLKNYRKSTLAKKMPAEKAMRGRMLGMILVFIIYVFLMDLFGYMVSSFLFLLAEFRLAGVTSWRTILIVTVVVLASFYLIFVQYCNMPFPRGIFY
jgi:hypothetical protein